MSTGSFETWITDRTLLPPSEEYSQLPAGEYVVIINEAPIGDTKSGKGIVCKLTMTVVDGQFKGQKIWANLNLLNENPIAQKIGQEQLSDLARALGLTAIPRHSAEIINQPLKVKVGPQKKDPERIEVKKFMSVGAAAVEAKTEEGMKKNPWQKK